MKRFIYFIMSLTIFITLYTPSKALANDSEYKIYCYLCTNDKQPINTLKYSIIRTSIYNQN